ncbi:MAG TPA: hypothetical protein VK188_03350, partial [Holophaga sp.]|nr:hypothetical protein [Holophaga sp.]
FGPDGRTVYLSARVQGRAPETFLLAPDGDAARPLGLPGTVLLGVSAEGDLALLRRNPGPGPGSLLRVPAGGGAARALAGDTLDATWAGADPLRLTRQGGRIHLDFPPGRPILDAEADTCAVTCLRASPDGSRLAFIVTRAGTSVVRVADRTGRVRDLFGPHGPTLTGLAWIPGGGLLCSEWEGDQTSLWDLSLRGRRRLVWRGDGLRQLLDVSPQGTVLLANQRVRRRVFLWRGGAAREISIFEGSQAADLSEDGRTLLLLESSAPGGGTSQDQAFLWREGQEGPQPLGRGLPLALVPGDAWQLSLASLRGDLEPPLAAALREAGLDPGEAGRDSALVFQPLAGGSPRILALPGDLRAPGRVWPVGGGLLFTARKGDRRSWYRWVPGKGEPRALRPADSLQAALPAPDGRRVAVLDAGGAWRLQSLDTARESQPIRGLAEGERPVAWSRDGHALLVASAPWSLPLGVWRLDPVRGDRAPALTFTPQDLTGHQAFSSLLAAGDGSAFAVTCERRITELFRVEGLLR